MAETFQVYPQGELRTGLPITVILASAEKPDRLVVHRKVVMSATDGTKSFVSDFAIPFTGAASNEYRAEFTVDLPGTYLLKTGQSEREILVMQQRFISFGVEFGLLSALVLVAFGGLLIWNHKKFERA